MLIFALDSRECKVSGCVFFVINLRLHRLKVYGPDRCVMQLFFIRESAAAVARALSLSSRQGVIFSQAISPFNVLTSSLLVSVDHHRPQHAEPHPGCTN